MSTTNPTINGVQVLWGMDGTVYEGILTNFGCDDQADEGEVLDNNGYRITDITFNQNSEYTLKIAMQSGTTKPAVGTMLTIDAVATCIVKKVGRAYVQKDVRYLNVTARYFVNLVA